MFALPDTYSYKHLKTYCYRFLIHSLLRVSYVSSPALEGPSAAAAQSAIATKKWRGGKTCFRVFERLWLGEH